MAHLVADINVKKGTWDFERGGTNETVR